MPGVGAELADEPLGAGALGHLALQRRQPDGLAEHLGVVRHDARAEPRVLADTGVEDRDERAAGPGVEAGAAGRLGAEPGDGLAPARPGLGVLREADRVPAGVGVAAGVGVRRPV